MQDEESGVFADATRDVQSAKHGVDGARGREGYRTARTCQLCGETVSAPGLENSAYCFTCATHAVCVCADIE